MSAHLHGDACARRCWVAPGTRSAAAVLRGPRSAWVGASLLQCDLILPHAPGWTRPPDLPVLLGGRVGHAPGLSVATTCPMPIAARQEREPCVSRGRAGNRLQGGPSPEEDASEQVGCNRGFRTDEGSRNSETARCRSTVTAPAKNLEDPE